MRSVLPDLLEALLPSALKDGLTEVLLSRGERLFLQGQMPQRMYFVLHGEVVLERPGESGAAVVLQRVRRGFIAEASLQAGHYHCDAVVTASGAALTLSLSLLRTQLGADSAFALRWIGMLNGEVRRLRAQCERLSFNSVSERLIHLVETEGTGGTLPLTRGLKSLAPELAVTHEALYRAVARLERDGLIRRAAGGIELI
jgi:CRP-like cAMP-binding protein